MAALAIGLGAVGVAAAQLPAASAAGMPSERIGGERPSYAPERVAAVPNEPAIVRRLWLPGLDDGFTPQGLALAGGAVLISGYRSLEPGVNRGPCRVYRIDIENGRETGRLDVPAPCGHAGGLALAGDDADLYIADTHMLFMAPLAPAFAGRAAPLRGVPLGPGLVGALAASASGAIWIGTYREDGPGRLFRFVTAALGPGNARAALTVAAASAQVAIPSYAQGAAIDRDGRLWVSRSDTDWGELVRLDAASGAVERRYAAPPGIEGIAFDRDGRLWAVSEAGARHAYDTFFARLFSPFFPLVFALDPQRLE